METDRRGMLGAILGSLAGIASVGAEEKKPTGERAFFKYDGRDWRRIAFEELKAGDRVFLVDFGETFYATAFRMAEPPDPSSDAMETEEFYDVMPKLWGIHPDPLDDKGRMRDEVADALITRGSIDQQFLERLLPPVRVTIPSSCSLSESDREKLTESVRSHYRGFLSPGELHRAIQAEISPG
jgi:hypothetical protein